MTRYLSQALGAQEPEFSQGVAQLEQASGRPSADIRLSTEIARRVRAKIVQLGLDPNDTTGPELYSALQERLRQDEQKVHAALGLDQQASPHDIMARVRQFATRLTSEQNCFALKTSVAKKLLRSKPPKAAMKALGYRSADSLIRHEQPALVMAAAQLCEGVPWHKNFRAQYAKLQPSDFEVRPITFLFPQTSRWLRLAQPYVSSAKHNIVRLTDLGALVFLPLAEHVDGLAITTLLLALNEANDIRIHSSYAKLQQVRPDFGKQMQELATREPYVSADIAGQAVPWRVIQRYYGQEGNSHHPEVFEPHVQAEDLQYRPAEVSLARLSAELSFWQDTGALFLLHEGQPVSLNALDVALSYCNHLPFADRIVHFVRQDVHHELLSRYLNQANLEHLLLGQLNNQLAPAV